MKTGILILQRAHIKMKNGRVAILIGALSTLLLGLQFAAAQGTAFTYQGRLIDGTNKANGSYDLSFTLYDDPTSGDVLGSVTNYAAAVSNGLFFTTVDFGPGVFTGASNWLDIAVATNGGSVFTELSPRQQVFPVPYAIRAESAAVADTALTAASAGAISATNITGTIADAQLSTNVALLDGSPTFAGTVSANGFAGNGAGLTNVPGTFNWTVVSNTNIQLQSNLGYLFTTNTTVTFTLPPTANPGDVIYISSGGFGGWKILQNAGQSIKSPNSLLNYSTWTNRPVPNNTAWSALACSTNGQRIMGVSSSFSGSISYPFVLSADGGVTWRTNGFSQSYSIASSADGSILYIGGSFGLLNTSTDFGSSWASTGLGNSANITGLACSADGTKVYAAGTSGFIFYSPDSGADWFQRNQSGNWTGLACSSDGSKVVAGSSGFVFTSSNFGANWTQRSIQARYVACSSDGTKIIAAQASGAVYISSDSGATWAQSSLASANWSSVASSADGTKLVAAVNGGLIFTSTDSGNTWIAQNSGSRNWFSLASSADGTKLIGGVNFGQIWTSQLTTTTSSTTGTSGYLQGLNFSTIQLLYMGNGVWNTITASGTVLAF
ncbi:MAG TPA: hypothetical protein VKV04_06445 [Verrucomicrobiae bacterium]|nr:hypothetical protein [Verrucomicrobiae bacterium]